MEAEDVLATMRLLVDSLEDMVEQGHDRGVLLIDTDNKEPLDGDEATALGLTVRELWDHILDKRDQPCCGAGDCDPCPAMDDGHDDPVAHDAEPLDEIQEITDADYGDPGSEASEEVPICGLGIRAQARSMGVEDCLRSPEDPIFDGFDLADRLGDSDAPADAYARFRGEDGWIYPAGDCGLPEPGVRVVAWVRSQNRSGIEFTQSGEWPLAIALEHASLLCWRPAPRGNRS